jgi:hypothetical protein
MAPASTIFQDDYEVTREPQHVHADTKRQTSILKKIIRRLIFKRL